MFLCRVICLIYYTRHCKQQSSVVVDKLHITIQCHGVMFINADSNKCMSSSCLKFFNFVESFV